MIEDFADARGVILRRDVVAAGNGDKPLQRAMAAGTIVRLRQGAYALAPLHNAASRAAKHRLLAHAAMRQYGDGVVRSHVSAGLEYGAPDWGIDLRFVHLTSRDRTAERAGARIRHHRGLLREEDVVVLDGMPITSPTRTALDTAVSAGRDAAVCVLDYFLNSGLTTRGELDDGFAFMREWPGALSLHRKLEHVHALSESVAETRTRLLCHDHHIPAPELQYEVRLASGELVGRVDFAWPDHGLILEFDGREKYFGLRRPGETVEDVIVRERRRESRIIEVTGWRIIRLTWSDLERPAETARRILRMLAQVAA